jgi:phage gp29-like protein
MTLYDAYGREVDTGMLREEQAAPTMAGVRNIYSVMHPSIGLTPERLSAILQQAEFGDPYLYLELAEEMEEKDLHYFAVLGTRKNAVAQLDLVVRAASSSADDQRAAAMVRELLVDGPIQLDSVLFDVLDAVGKGFSATEIMWDTTGREWFPAQLKWRDPRWFAFDWISGEAMLVRTLKGEIIPVEGETQAQPTHFGGNGLYAPMRGGIGIQPMTAPLAPYKFITHLAQAKAGLPIRGGLARAAGWAYLFKNYVLKDWVTFTEVFGQPLRVSKYHPGASENDKQALLNAVSRLGTDAAAIMPDSMVIEFTEAHQNGSAGLYQSFCEYLDAQVSKAVLGQTLTTEMPRSGGGSRAAAQVHEGVRRDIMNADARRLAATLARDLARPIVELNMGPQVRYPKIELGLPDDADVKVFAEIVAMLADRGLRVGQKTILDKLGIAEAGEGEAVLGAVGGSDGIS